MEEVKEFDWTKLMGHRKLNIFEKIWYPIYRFIRDLPDKPGDVKHWLQRANKGYDDTYYWGIDYHLVEIIPPILKDLRKYSHGYPAGLNSMEEWYEILDKMILGWEAAKRALADEYLDKYQPKWFEKGEAITKEASKKSHEEMMKDMETFKEMMPLFTEYFFNLWD
jgi:hypothetical protein